QGVVHLAGPGEGEQPHTGEPGGGGDRGGLQQTGAVGAAADRVGGHGHHDRELLLGVLVGPGREFAAHGGLVAVPDRSVFDGPVGRQSDLHQPARSREGLVQAVPREGRAQVAVDGTPGGGDLLSVLRGRRLRDCRTRRLHVPGRLLALVGPGGPPPFGRTRPFRTTTRQHSHPVGTGWETARRVGRAEGRIGPYGGRVEYETRHVRGGVRPRAGAQVASASKGGRSSAAGISGFFVMSTRPPDEGAGEGVAGSVSRPWTASATSAISFFRSKPLRISFSPRSSLSSCLRMNVLGLRSSYS